jgi:hypothetical protein
MQVEVRPQSAVNGTSKRPTTNSRIIDRALRRARIDQLPRTEQERVHNLCVAAVGDEQDVGRVCTICENLGRREVASWLEENRKTEAAILQKVRKADEFYRNMLSPFIDHEVPAPDAPPTAEGICEHSCGERENEPEYHPELYRSAVRRAVSRARSILPKCRESRKDCQDLQQDCEIEIWRVSKRKEISAKLAYKIAKDMTSNFLKEKIEETVIRICDADGNPVLNELGLARGLNGAELKRKCEDESLSDADRKAAKDLLNDYQATAPRIERFVPEDSEETDEDEDYNPSTDAKLSRGQDVHLNETVLAYEIDISRARQQLVESWHGQKRAIAEAVLTGNFTVQKYADASGMAPATVGRIYATVDRGFKSIIKKVEKT